MLPLLLSLLLTPPALPKDVAQFKAAFAARRNDTPGETPDPAISKCLGIVLAAVDGCLREHPQAGQKDVERWVAPFASAVANPADPEPPADDLRNIAVESCVQDGLTFIVVRMGAVTRTVVFDRSWHPLDLPKEFYWSSPWGRFPVRVRGGSILVWGDSIEALGSRAGLRLLWLKHRGRRLLKVGEYEAVTTLDYLRPTVVGNRVTTYTVDNPRSFYVSSATPIFGRLTTWDCASGRPRLVGVQLLHQTLRAIDHAAWAAAHTHRPTPLQRRIRKLWSYNDDLGDWSEKRMAGGVTRVTCQWNLAFDLKRGPHGYRVVAVRRTKRTAQVRTLR
jgi:hypothetical protein